MDTSWQQICLTVVCVALLQELNRIFVRSDRLNSEAIVEFVRALCAVAREELRAPGAPRVYSLTKIVEIAHFNMTRIRCPLLLCLHAAVVACITTTVQAL